MGPRVPTDTVMLGRIIELVTGESYGAAVTERILAPLGLTQTSLPDGSTLPAPAASGITLQGGGDPAHPTDATDWSPSFGWSAGALVSTVPDLVAYGKALITGDGLLDRTVQRARIESVAAGGYGQGIGCTGGWIGHTGELPGYNTVVSYDTASQTLVVVAVYSDIRSGACTQSPTLPGHDDPALACMDPAVRILVEISETLGHPYPLPSSQS